ncbi:hypothetical protein KPL71_014100 [Citrus sinensis]|uniref:Uncharacterized protein n=1 Tax=Citrus sinensis TaxID=2711 RepID=A0ACB8K9A9_CITSI|nr:hypothetical protein KPL71_014100 [Citrus sinensis]
MDSSSVQERLNAVFRYLLQQPCKAKLVLHKVLLTSRQLQKQEAVEPVIIGGMVLDIHATPSIPANPKTTTPGKVNYVLGGVARNVAECMSKLGAKPYMISALGLDMAGDFAFYFVRFRMKSPTIRNLLLHSNIEWPVWKVMFYALEIGIGLLDIGWSVAVYMDGIKVQLEDARLLHKSWTNRVLQGMWLELECSWKIGLLLEVLLQVLMLEYLN